MQHLIFILLGAVLLGCTATSDPSPITTNDHQPPVNTKQLDTANYNVALLIMDGTFNSELTAPMDIFHHTIFRDSIRPMNVFTIAQSLDPVTTFEGLRILPDFSYSSTYPPIDILVIPAAEHHLDTDLMNEDVLAFIRDVAPHAMYVASHCDGAFLLAKTGLLDQAVSTTFPGDIDAYRKMYPHLTVEQDVLFVHDGKFITSAGGAKSFEASLYLCELMYGKKVADELAQGMVIDWDLSSLIYLRVE